MKKAIAIAAILMMMVTLGCAGSSSTQTGSGGGRAGAVSDQDLSAIGGQNAAVGSSTGSPRTNAELYRIVGAYRIP